MEMETAPITLLQLRNLSLKLGRQAPPAIVALLSETVWGTPGAMRYQHLDTASKIPHLQAPWFLYMEKEAAPVGVLCLDQRVAGELPAFYIRYFSFTEGMRRKGVQATEGQGQTSKGQGMFKRFTSTFFEAPDALMQAAAVPKCLFYAFVELENARSRDMVAQMGLQSCGQFSTLIFSRLFPRAQAHVRRALPAEYPQIREMVRDAYADHAFFDDHGLFYQGDYFVVEQGGKIVAGCQAQRVHWRVVEIPGMVGKVMMRVLPWLPLVSRLFNPHKFEFAGIEGLFCSPGHAHCLQPLLEGVLAMQGMHTALMWLSPDAGIYQAVKTHVRLGILQALKKEIAATVVMRGYGLSPTEVEALSNKPVYISAFDAT
jgi:hypothetical protein